jgi:hypothetical protein
MDVVLRIEGVAVDKMDRPLEPVTIRVAEVKRSSRFGEPKCSDGTTQRAFVRLID